MSQSSDSFRLQSSLVQSLKSCQLDEVSTSILDLFLLDFSSSVNGNSMITHDGSMGRPVYLDTLKVEFYGFHVGEYTVRPIDPSWVIKCRLLGGAFFKILLFWPQNLGFHDPLWLISNEWKPTRLVLQFERINFLIVSRFLQRIYPQGLAWREMQLFACRSNAKCESQTKRKTLWKSVGSLLIC